MTDEERHIAIARTSDAILAALDAQSVTVVMIAMAHVLACILLQLQDADGDVDDRAVLTTLMAQVLQMAEAKRKARSH